MNHCVRLSLLFTPSLIALGLLGIAFATNWWIIVLEKNIPNEKDLNVSSNEVRTYSTLVRIPVSRGLFSECNAYRNVKVLVSTQFDFRTELTREQSIKVANENCTSDQYQCHAGVAIVRPLTRCINRLQRCDRIVHCEDKSDELSCNEHSKTRDNEFFQCATGYSKCQDGKTCYRRDEQTCDGVSNCIDNSDEKDCNMEKCQKNKRVYCPKTGQCARRENSKRCDGIIDCPDNSDEENCDQCENSASVISCDSKCLPGKYLCDGVVQCSDLRDESNCDDYTTNMHRTRKLMMNDQKCIEQRLNPFLIQPPMIDSSQLEAYPSPNHRVDYLNLLFYLQLGIFYCNLGGLIFLLLAVISLFFFVCCRRRCISVPFYFYGLWMLAAWLLISTALIAFVFQWLWQKHTVLDPEKFLPLEVEIHEINRSLRNIEFFGLSFWLACGAALSTFIGLLLSYCVCCTVGSSRADDKEYAIMHIENYQ